MAYTREQKAEIWLDSFGLDYAIKRKIYRLATTAYGLVSEFFKYKPAVAEYSEEAASRMEASLQDGAYLNKILDTYAKKRIECIGMSAPQYPEELRQMLDPPFMLYCRGDVGLLGKRKFAIVGSRHTTAPVMKRTQEFARAIARSFVIVTGLADGGDTAALTGALEGGKAIVVLAYGLDHVYPGCNRALLKRAEQSGLVISEYAPHEPPAKYRFPWRNRILAGLSEGVLVVSGGEKSGTRITAERAYEYGKDVFAFPYEPGVPSGVGCNALIKEYAKLTDNLVDIGDAFGINLSETEEIVLTGAERAVFEILREGEAHVTEIAQKSGMKPYELPIVLTALEMKKLIVNCGGNRWAAVR